MVFVCCLSVSNVENGWWHDDLMTWWLDDMITGIFARRLTIWYKYKFCPSLLPHKNALDYRLISKVHSALVIGRRLTSDPLPVPGDPALDEVLPGPGVGDGVSVRRGVQLHLLWIHGSLPPQGHIPSILFAKSFTVDLKGHQISFVFACWQKVTFSKLENEKDNLLGRYLSGI